MNIIAYSVNSVAIELRTTDGYLNGTAMCAAHSKDISDWLKTDETWELVTALANDLGVVINSAKKPDSVKTRLSASYPTLVIVKRGSPENGGGTWLHPDLAIQLAQWCSPAFALQVSRWVREWMTTGSVSIQSPQPLDLQNTLSLLNGLLDPLATKGVDVALIQSAKMSAIALQHPEYQRLLTAVKEELTLLTPDEDRRYNPTRLGELYAQRHQLEKPVPARLINIALQKAGFQIPEYRINSKGKQVFDWKLTQSGEQYGKVFLESAQGSNKTITVIRWLPSVLNALEIQGQKDD